MPLREHIIEVDSTRPVYTDRSYKQGKSLDKTIYRKNFDRSALHRINSKDRNEASTLGPKETTPERSVL